MGKLAEMITTLANEFKSIDLIDELNENSRELFDKIEHSLIITVFNEIHPENIPKGID
jgi:hypothetical protein